MGLHTKQIFLSSTIREFAGKHNAICIKISISQRWTGCGWISRKAGLLPCLFDVGGSAGVPPGAAAFGGRGAAPGPPLGLPNKRARPGPKARLALSGRFAPCRRPPPGTLEFPPAQAIHPPSLSAPASSEQNERAAPDERPAGIFRRKPREVFQQVFPRFFQKRARGLGAEPPTGSRGSAPDGVQGRSPGSRAPSRHPEQAAGVLEGGVQQLRQGALVELRQLLGDEGEVGGIVALAPVGHRGHVGAIGLQ